MDGRLGLGLGGGIPVVVLCGAQGVGNALDGVHNGAGEVVCRIGLMPSTSLVVRSLVEPGRLGEVRVVTGRRGIAGGVGSTGRAQGPA